jgi:hypothetical protein
MRNRIAVICSIALVALGASAQASAQAARSMKCYVVIKEGASSEGNSLFIQKMGVEPELIKSFAPSRFTKSAEGFAFSTQGSFAYQAESPVFIERSGKLALYEVPVRIKAEVPTRGVKKLNVTLRLADVQPDFAAMRAAAAKSGWTTGTAWIVEMKRTGKGLLSAVVGLAK